VKPSDELSARLANVTADKLYYEYAREGYWYDAIENLSRLMRIRKIKDYGRVA